jgi:hypothetical protein
VVYRSGTFSVAGTSASRTLLGMVILLAMGIAGCSTMGGPHGSSGGLRRFYLTKTTFQGNAAMTACGAGYHMASRFEILDVGVLDYDAGTGLTTDDSGSGPPSRPSRGEPIGPAGWVRTGRPSRFTEASPAGSASTNCGAWSSSSHEAYGTIAYLVDRFGDERGAAVGPWGGEAQSCDQQFHVWCVGNGAPREPASSDEESHHHRHPE